MDNRIIISDKIINKIPDNDQGLIQPEDVREVLNALNESSLNLITDQSLLGLNDWNSSKSYNQGQCATYNKIVYRLKTNTNTIGVFNTPSEWEQIASYIASTSGFADFIKKNEGIELEPNKLIKALSNDESITDQPTGFYLVSNSASPTGLNQEYPTTGKGIVTVLKRSSQSESIILYYSLEDLTKTYIKKVNGNWLQLNNSDGSGSYTFTNGLTESSGFIGIGGDYETISLTGETLNVLSDNIQLNTSEYFNKSSISLFGDFLNVGYNTNFITFNNGYIRVQANNFILKNLDDSLSVVLNSTSGLNYSGNYSANFTDRTLIDKGYLDQRLSSVGGGSGSKFITDSSIISALTNNSNWDSNGDYSGIINVADGEGSFYKNEDYFYFFVSSSTPIRMIKG